MVAKTPAKETLVAHWLLVALLLELSHGDTDVPDLTTLVYTLTYLLFAATSNKLLEYKKRLVAWDLSEL